MEINRKRFILCFLSLIYLIVFTGCTPTAVDYDQVGPEDKLILKFSHVTGQDTPKGLAAARFKELVEKKSKGKVEVQVFPNSTLYSDEEELDELQRGGIQLIAPAISKLSDVVEEVQFFDLPYIFSSQEDVWRAMQGPIGQEIQRLLKDKGYRVLAVWDNGFKQITNNTHSIRHPEDFGQLHFRSMPSEALVKQFELVDAKSDFVPFHQLYTALEQGKVQGEENTISNIYSKKLYKNQQYLTRSDHGYLGYFVLANESFWEQIPKPTRQMLEKTMQEVTEWERDLAIEKDKEDYQKLKKETKLHIIELSDKEKEIWKEAFKPSYQWYLKSIQNKVISDAFKKEWIES